MPHLSLILFSGTRVAEQRVLELGMTLPGLQQRGKAIGELPGLGLLTLAGMLPDEWTCSYHTSAGDVDALAETIVRERPMLVALSALTASIDEAYRLSDLLRAEGLQVVIGGLHVTACADEARRHCPSVVVGEGEPVWLDVLADAERGTLRPTYSSFGKPYPAVWPTPRFDLLPAVPQRFTLQTERGCPLACEFCGASRLLGAFREKPIEAIRHELNAIRQLSPRPLVELADDNTFVGKRSPEEFFQVFADSGVRYFTEADWRIAERPELLAGLAHSGCVQVLMGIESMVFRYPGMGKKASELERMVDAVKAIQATGVAVNGCFILGADGETRESIDRLVQFLVNSPFADVQLTLQTPFPGTALYDRLKHSGRLLPERGWPYYSLFDVTFQPDKLSVAELEQAFAEALQETFSAPATERRNALRKQVWKRNPQFHRAQRP